MLVRFQNLLTDEIEFGIYIDGQVICLCCGTKYEEDEFDIIENYGEIGMLGELFTNCLHLEETLNDNGYDDTLEDIFQRLIADVEEEYNGF